MKRHYSPKLLDYISERIQEHYNQLGAQAAIHTKGSSSLEETTMPSGNPEVSQKLKDLSNYAAERILKFNETWYKNAKKRMR